MSSIRKILVPVALSPACAWAARYSASLATQLGAELLFVHVADQSAARELERFLHREIPGAACRSIVLTGEPADSIVAYAAEQTCDLIVMPTHAYGRFRRFLLGSVTSKVLHDADCPVWTGVHHQDAPFSDQATIRSVVCAVDLSPNCIPVICWAQNLAGCFQAVLKVIHAEPAADETSDNAGEIELRHHLFRRAQAKFEGWCGPAGLKIEIEQHGGSVAQVVREAVLRERADLVVIGRGHAQGTLGRLRTGAYGIIRDSPCPVLSI